jgi:molybdopterin-guanine dinucleotide biosynthesis protein A
MKPAGDGNTLPAAPVGLVLAGGDSRRMGRDKARLTLDGASLPASAAQRLAVVCSEVAVADRGRGTLPGFSSLPDGPGRGPAAGILGAAAVYPGRPLLVLACDLPGVPAALLAELARSIGFDWAVPRWSGGIEPLCALYGSTALAVLAERVAAGLHAPHRLAEDLRLAVRYLEGEALSRFGAPEEIFLNLNTPEDLERYASMASGTSPQRPHGQISRRKSKR